MASGEPRVVERYLQRTVILSQDVIGDHGPERMSDNDGRALVDRGAGDGVNGVANQLHRGIRIDVAKKILDSVGAQSSDYASRSREKMACTHRAERPARFRIGAVL